MIFGDRSAARRQASRVWLLGASLAVVAVGCISIDPNWEAADDPGADASASEVPVACQICLATPNDPGPGCADEYAICAADETCDALNTCVIGSGCHPAEDLQAFYACAWPCADQYGVTLYDAIYEIAMPVAYCIMDNCEAECAALPAE